MVRSKVGSESLHGVRADARGEALKRPESGVYAIPHAVAASYDVAVARDEYVGLDRLDREDLDETDDDKRVVPATIRVILPTLRKSA